MYFTRLSLKPQAAGRSLARALLRDSYRGHQALWRLFDEDPEAKRDFLYRQIFEGGSLKYYVLSSRRPHDRAGVWNIEGAEGIQPAAAKRPAAALYASGKSCGFFLPRRAKSGMML